MGKGGKVNEKNNDCYGIKNLEVTDGYFGAPLHQMNGEQVEDLRDMLIR